MIIYFMFCLSKTNNRRGDFDSTAQYKKNQIEKFMTQLLLKNANHNRSHTSLMERHLLLYHAQACAPKEDTRRKDGHKPHQ